MVNKNEINLQTVHGFVVVVSKPLSYTVNIVEDRGVFQVLGF